MGGHKCLLISCLQYAKTFADIPGFISSSIIIGDDSRSNLLLSIFNEFLYIKLFFLSNLKITTIQLCQSYWKKIQGHRVSTMNGT